MKNIPIRHIENKNLKEPDIFKSFNIRNLQDLLAGKAMAQELHRHDFYYFLALKKGAGSHEIDFLSNVVSDNSVFFMRPGQVHQLSLKAGSTGYLMEFNSDFYHSHDKVSNQQLRKASNQNHYLLDDHKFKRLNSILTYIFQEYADKKEGYQEVIKANLDILFIELSRQKSESYSTYVNSYTQERLENFLELLQKDISNHKQVVQYAEMLNLSPYQLNSITKATLGKTCSELINEHIILESKRYLLATSNQVNQIAYLLGYEDISYFIRFFKKHTGYSPEAFRHNFR
jgi:AraC family transcriptional activator of pobA